MNSFRELSAEEAASYINNGDTVGFGGFTPAGAPKAVSVAIAKRAVEEHSQGRPFKIGVITGASTGPSLDGALAKAEAISFRTPYQSDKDLRKGINDGSIHFFDMHLSHTAQYLRYGFLGKVNCAIVEACDVNSKGEITLTTGVGNAPIFCRLADKVIIELNAHHPSQLKGLHDIYEPLPPPNRREIPIYKVSDRIGAEVLKVDPKKIIGIVKTNTPDEVNSFTPTDEVKGNLGEKVAEFLAAELKAGRIPSSFLPIQSGVGNIANAVLGALGSHPDIPPFQMYSEVIQDAVINLMKENRVTFASGTSITISNEVRKDLYENLNFFKSRLLLRPQEISNHPEIVRRLGLITINTALEIDIWGNVNSTHVLGKNIMNGIGGSGDFTRNAYVSIFTCPSLAKDGNISTIVPFCSHLDHHEHDVQVIITDQGIADLRGKDPIQRANVIIDNCVHPSYKDQLRRYLSKANSKGHIPLDLKHTFDMHLRFADTGSMKE